LWNSARIDENFIHQKINYMKNNSKADLLVKNVSWIYFGKLVTQIFGLIVSILVIRKLSVGVFGTYNFLVASYVVFNVLVVSPIVSVFHRYIPELIQDKDYFRLKKLIFKGFGVFLIALLAILFMSYFLKAPFAKFFNIINFNDYILSFTLFVFVMSFKGITVATVTSLLLQKNLAIFRMISSAISPFVYLAFLPILNVNIMLLISIFLSLVITIPSIWVLIRFIRKGITEYKKVAKGRQLNKRIIRFGLLSSFNELGAGIVSKTSDFFIIAALGSQYLVGVYSFAHKLFNLVYKVLPMEDFLSVVRPIFYRKFTQKYDKKEFIQIYNFIVKIMLPIFLFPSVYFLIFGKGIINYIYSPKYINAYWVTCVVLASGITTAIFYPLGLVVRLFEKMEITLYSKIVVVFSIVAGIYGMKTFGILGVAFATLLGQLLKNCFIYFMIRRKVLIRYRFREMINFLYISTFLVVTFFFLQPFITNIYSLIVFSIVFVVVFLFLAILFHPFNNMDIALLRKIADSSKILKKVFLVVSRIHTLKPKFNTISE